MTSLVSIILFLIFLFLSLIHIYWACGGKWGKDAAIPTKENNSKIIYPTFLLTFIVAFGLLAFAIIILIEAKLLSIQIPGLVSKYSLWVIATVFLIRAVGDLKYVGFFKRIKHTKFSQNDTSYYSPLCLAIGILTIILEVMK